MKRKLKPEETFGFLGKGKGARVFKNFYGFWRDRNFNFCKNFGLVKGKGARENLGSLGIALPRFELGSPGSEPSILDRYTTGLQKIKNKVI